MCSFECRGRERQEGEAIVFDLCVCFILVYKGSPDFLSLLTNQFHVKYSCAT